MRTTCLLILVFTSSLFATNVNSQVAKVSIAMKNVYLLEVIKAIEDQTNYLFVYDKTEINLTRRVDLTAENKSVAEILNDVFSNTNVVYAMEGNNIMLMPNSNSQQPQKSVSGKVVDPTGALLPGVSVVVKGTANGIITDENGNYLLTNIPENATLQFSFVGMKTQELPVGSKTTIDVTLAEDAIGIEEVVAVGYGTKRKADITSAVSVINIDDIGDTPVSNASRLLQGQAPGLVVRQRSGTPGEQMNVTIRGIGSLGAGSDPLYVVDGFAVGTSIGQNLNPHDIESITVLKDAASTAIYGARGSNGVILITTRNAKEGDFTITAKANYGIQNLPDSRKIKMMNGVEFATFLQESWMDKKRYFEKREPSIDEVPIGIRFPGETMYSTNWQDEILNQNASFQDYNVTLTSGVRKMKSLISIGYLNQEGAVIETGFQRYNVRANILGDFNKYISVGLNTVGSFSTEDFAGTNGRDAIIGKALWADPREPVYNEDGTFNDYIGANDGVFGSTNPVMELHQYKRTREVTNLTTNAFLQVSFLRDFKFKTSFNASLDNSRRNDFRPSTLAGSGFNQPPKRDANLWEWYENNINIAADQILSYVRNNNNHKFEAQIGYSAQNSRWRQLYGTGSKFPNDDIRFLQQAETRNVSSAESSWSLLAYFSRLNYDYKNKYLMTATFRREGSSRFGVNNKWGDFPSVSVGWRLSEERFLDNASWINDMKLRGSFGITGNNSIGEYNNAASLAAAGYILGDKYNPGVVLNSFVNNNIGWEESNQLDIGLDLSIFDNKVNFTAEYYDKVTNDMLLPVNIPVITGFTNSFTNIGKVQNYGIELAVGYKQKVNNDFNIRGNFNIAFNRNKVLEIDGENDELWTGTFYGVHNRSVVGRPIGMLTGFKVLGIFNTDEEIAASPKQDGAIPGVYKYWDATGDGTITYDTKDMVEIGNPHPDFNWAFTLEADYKGFDFNALFMGAQNYDIMREIEKTTMNMDGVFNIMQSAVNRWRSAENPGDGRGATSNTWKWERESNSRYVYDASHAWVKSITMGYTLSNEARILKSTRFYVTAENLFLITNYPGTNPDINTSGDNKSPGRDDEAYPVPRTFSLGAVIKF